MSKHVCRSCGYGLSPSHEDCPYCGTANPNYVKPTKESNQRESFDFSNVKFSTNTSSTSSSDSEINVCLLIFLVIVFWPAAIIYAVVKMSKK